MATAPMYIIYANFLGYVKKFTGKRSSVLFTDRAGAKKFKTEQKARDFIAHYADRGYGFDSKGLKVMAIS